MYGGGAVADDSTPREVFDALLVSWHALAAESGIPIADELRDEYRVKFVQAELRREMRLADETVRSLALIQRCIEGLRVATIKT